MKDHNADLTLDDLLWFDEVGSEDSEYAGRLCWLLNVDSEYRGGD